MLPQYRNLNITAVCPDCGYATTFERGSRGNSSELGCILVDVATEFHGKQYTRLIYRLFRCSVCNRGGIGKLHDSGSEQDAILGWFFPMHANPAKIPDAVPKDLQSELREAELCASVGAWRAATVLLRSLLEKLLKANGYTKENDSSLKDLFRRIDAAADDRIITDSRRKKAHDDVRALGNDVVHDEWREVTPDEYETAHHYVQRILEDFYDDRLTAEVILVAKKRLPPVSEPKP